MCGESQFSKIIIILVTPFVLVFSACQQTATVVLPLPPPSPTIMVTQFAEDEYFFDPYQNDPIFFHGNRGSWFEDNFEPGAIVFQDGNFHLFFNGIKDWPAKVLVGYTTSTDGVQWDLN